MTWDDEKKWIVLTQMGLMHPWTYKQGSQGRQKSWEDDLNNFLRLHTVQECGNIIAIEILYIDSCAGNLRKKLIIRNS